jgi:hypothetical protein
VSDLSRRVFAESLACAALAPLIGARPESIRLQPWANAPTHSLEDHPGKLAKALAEVIRTQYGSRLSPGDLATITRQIQSGLERVDQLKKVDLSNGDEPDFVFIPYRAPLQPS